LLFGLLMKNFLEQELEKVGHRLFPDVKMPTSLVKKKYADYSCDVILKIAKKLKCQACEIIPQFLKALPNLEGIAQIEIDSKGFINIFINRFSQNQMISDALDTLVVRQSRQFSSKDWEVIQYAYVRIHQALLHLPKAQKDFSYKELLREEQNLIDCLEDLLSVFYISSDEVLFKQLHNFSLNIHRYFNVITLLCDNQNRYQFQIHLLKQCDRMLETGLLTFGLSCPESIIW